MNIKIVLDYLKNYDGEDITLMEICGTHTASISENAIASLLSDKIHLVSGPGCPVCVTVSSYVDRLCELATQENNVIVTFGDMMRVPGAKGSLNDAKAEGADVRMVYSPAEMIDIAKAEPDKNFVFSAVGFETTTPAYALLLENAVEEHVKNLRLLTALKTMPPVIRSLCRSENKIDGFIAPGHVAAITGSNVFASLAKEFNLPFAVSGFSAEEILASIYALVKMHGEGRSVNLYKSVVKEKRNEKATRIVEKYFEPCNTAWRGLGIIKDSGLVLREEFSHFDAGSKMLYSDDSHQKGCICCEIITGVKKPYECPLYKKACSPGQPKGACMVSNEGSCFNYFINDRND